MYIYIYRYIVVWNLHEYAKKQKHINWWFSRVSRHESRWKDFQPLAICSWPLTCFGMPGGRTGKPPILRSWNFENYWSQVCPAVPVTSPHGSLRVWTSLLVESGLHCHIPWLGSATWLAGKSARNINGLLGNPQWNHKWKSTINSTMVRWDNDL